MKKLMAIFAHPDDEGVVAGTMVHYVRQGVDTTLVCATRGEVGEISDPALATPETLGAVREAELRAAAEVLGVQRVLFLDRRDSGMKGTPENGAATALVQAQPAEVIGQLVGLMRQFQPDVVITFEPFGWYGHPDHVITSRWVTEAYPLAGDGLAYPDRGLPWQPARLFYAVTPASSFAAIIAEAIESGLVENSGFGDDFPIEQQLQTEARITHVVDVAAVYETKERANEMHRTQNSADGIFSKIPRETLKKAWSNEYYIQVFPEPTEPPSPEKGSDLFPNPL